MNDLGIKEIVARDYFKKLPDKILVDSTFLLGVDFDNTQLEEIMNSIGALVEHINSVEALIKDYEEPGRKVLRISSTLPNDIYIDLGRKKEALSYILANSDVIFLFNKYLNDRDALKYNSHHP